MNDESTPAPKPPSFKQLQKQVEDMVKTQNWLCDQVSEIKQMVDPLYFDPISDDTPDETKECWPRLDEEDMFWFLLDGGAPTNTEKHDTFVDSAHQRGNYFYNKDQTEARVKWERLHTALYRYAYRDGWRPDWGNANAKFVICFSHPSGGVGIVPITSIQSSNEIYFRSEVDARHARDNILGDDAEFYCKYDWLEG